MKTLAFILIVLFAPITYAKGTSSIAHAVVPSHVPAHISSNQQSANSGQSLTSTQKQMGGLIWLLIALGIAIPAYRWSK